jgi:hypothetical protein
MMKDVQPGKIQRYFRTEGTDGGEASRPPTLGNERLQGGWSRANWIGFGWGWHVWVAGGACLWLPFVLDSCRHQLRLESVHGHVDVQC